MNSRRSLCTVLLVAFCATLVAAGPTTAESSDTALKYVFWTIDWYRRVAAFAQTPADTDEAVFRDAAVQKATQSLQRGFKFAHADAALLTITLRQAATASPTTQGAGKKTLQELTLAAAAHIDQLNGELQEVQEKQHAPATDPTSQPAIDARVEKIKAELELATIRHETLQGLSAFSSDQGASGWEAMEQQVSDLEHDIPEAVAGGTAAPTLSATQQNPSPATQGVLSLIGRLFDLSHRMGEVKRLQEECENLSKYNAILRDPLRTGLTDTLHRSDALTQSRDNNDAKSLDAERAQIQVLTERYKLLAGAISPLVEQNFLLDSGSKNLQAWHDSLDSDYEDVLRYVVIRLGAIAGSLLLLVVIAKLWQRITFRYVADVRRRRQFMVIRRLVVGALSMIILLGGVVTEYSSLATYAGLLTAGVAVALQAIILSGIAHFFLIGRYGVRVGDRVTMSGITGDVIEIGLFRLYLMELGGSHLSLQPTGRVAVFANSVLFQPTAFYKQLPGAEYAWRELALTLSPDSDYKLAESQLMKAVEQVYGEYRASIEEQHKRVSEALHLQIAPPHPEGRLRLVDAGLEFVVRYPVELRRASEIDDRITRALVLAIESEPNLKFVATGTPKIQAVVAQAALP